MTIKKTLMLFTLVLAASTHSYGYTIFNKTGHSVQVKDKSGFGGIDVTLPTGGSASCKPSASGCHGKINFAVYATQRNGKVICTWTGKIDSGSGNYFVISPVQGIHFLEAGSCNVEYYRE